MIRAEELERQEFEAKYGRLSEEEMQEEAEKVRQYRQYRARQTGQWGGGMWE